MSCCDRHSNVSLAFDILNVPRSATTAEVKAAYRNVAKLLHPDIANQTASTSKQAEEVDERFRVITAAYDLLKDGNRRSNYLRSGIGWSTAKRMYEEVPLDFRHNPWGTAKTRSDHRRPAHPSGEWDWHQEAYQFDEGFYTNNFRYGKDPPSERLMSNRTLVWSLGGLSFSMYMYQMLSVIPSSTPEHRERLATEASSGDMSSMLRQEQIARTLAQARYNARQHAETRREGIKAAARYQREKGKKGHLASESDSQER